jgi:hypothetical protein
VAEEGRRQGIGLLVRVELAAGWNGDFNGEDTEYAEKKKERERRAFDR